MNLKEYKSKKMNDPEFAKAYEEIQPEMNVIRAIIDARISQNITQCDPCYYRRSHLTEYNAERTC